MTIVPLAARGRAPLAVATHALMQAERTGRRAADVGDAESLQFAVETLQVLECHGASRRIRRAAANAVRALLPRLRGGLAGHTLDQGGAA